MVKQLCFWFFIFFSLSSVNSQNYPGGVTGAEVWYIADWRFIEDDLYPNQADTDIKISNCSRTDYVNGLLNFNFAIQALKEESKYLCLEYDAPLENTYTRNVFFTSKQEQIEEAYSHLRTNWNQSVVHLPQDYTPNENRFDFGNMNSQTLLLETSYSSSNNANVNFYRWNKYSADRKYKSYGLEGETKFSIGDEFLFSINEEEQASFSGVFPEFISFTRELNENEKSRVESYLALKYGLTLDNNKDYLSSKNIVFWKKENNKIFGNHIFGLGKDEISTLNQLQSESVHVEDYLAASIGKLLSTNFEKQELINIENNHFLVFGDNGEFNSLSTRLNNGFEILKKVWLVQREGEKFDSYPISFRLHIREEILEILSGNPSLRLWMLHDKYVSNDEQSDFNRQHVEYYQASNFDEIYGYFREIYFDTDSNGFDQYTFGIGPEMIVQARYAIEECGEDEFETTIHITGGQSPYRVNIEDSNGSNERFTINNNQYDFIAFSPSIYTITVVDDNEVIAETRLDVRTVNINVDLGPNQSLSQEQQEILLDTSVDVSDEEVSFEWFLNSELLPHYESTLLVSEPGEYTVIVTSDDRSCSVNDSIIIDYDFSGNVNYIYDCENSTGTVSIYLMGGQANFTTEIIGNDQSFTQVHSTSNLVFTGLEYGNYIFSSTDAVGNAFEESFEILDPLLGMSIDIASQLVENYDCTAIPTNVSVYPGIDCSELPVIVDASENIDPNLSVSYEWFVDGFSFGHTDPILIIDNDNNGQFPSDADYTVRVTNLDNGCYIVDGIYLKGLFPNPGESFSVGNEQNDIKSIKSKVYPNPSNQSNTFYYTVYSEEVFDATVEIFSPTGALINRKTIVGQSQYIMPYNILAVGVYFIKTTTADTIITDKVIIQ